MGVATTTAAVTTWTFLVVGVLWGALRETARVVNEGVDICKGLAVLVPPEGFDKFSSAHTTTPALCPPCPRASAWLLVLTGLLGALLALGVVGVYFKWVALPAAPAVATPVLLPCPRCTAVEALAEADHDSTGVHRRAALRPDDRLAESRSDDRQAARQPDDSHLEHTVPYPRPFRRAAPGKQPRRKRVGPLAHLSLGVDELA